MSTTIISVLSRKGGSTKTTTATTLAVGLALRGLNVLLIESDGQGDASKTVGLEPRDDFYNLVLGDAEFADVIRPVPVKFTGKQVDLAILSAADATRVVEEDKQTPSVMYARFQELRGYYDVVIGDTSPGITNVHSGWYYASDYVLLPTLCETDSVHSIGKTLSFLAKADEDGRDAGYPAAKVIGILPNRYSKAEKTSQFNLGLIHGMYGRENHVFEHVRDLTAWGTARRENKSIYSLTGGFDRRLQMSLKDARKEFNRVVDYVYALTRNEVTA